MAHGCAETLIKPCIFAHPGRPSDLRRALRPAGGPRPARLANLGPARGLKLIKKRNNNKKSK